MKTEPSTYSIDDLKKDKATLWEGVRNYQARNFMKEMQVGDQVLFYHSSAEPPGIAGLAVVSKAAIADPSQFKKGDYFEAKAKPDKPLWFCVEIKFNKKFGKFIPLDQLRETKGIEGLMVLKRGQRLSVQPVDKSDFDTIVKLA